MRIGRKAKSFFAGFMLLCAAIYFGMHSPWFQKKFVYPYPYKEIVAEYSEARRLDAALVAGVILSESRFRIQAQSHKGAVGLMQIMPDTAKWIAEQTHYEDFNVEDLQDPEINIRFGTWYLSSLEKEFYGNEVLMLAAYNAGRGNVKEWMGKYGWDMEFSDISQIPFRETREYVAKVLKSKQQYRNLYTEPLG